MSTIYVLCASLIINCTFKFTVAFGILGPANFEFIMLEKCSGTEDHAGGIDFSYAQRKFNRTDYISDLKLKLDYELDDSIIVEFKGSIKKEGGYKQGSVYIEKPICEAFRIAFGDIFQVFLNHIGLEDCPIPRGTYDINDFYFNNDIFKVPKVYGEYKMEINIYKDSEKIKCYNAFYEFTPKE